MMAYFESVVKSTLVHFDAWECLPNGIMSFFEPPLDIDVGVQNKIAEMELLFQPHVWKYATRSLISRWQNRRGVAPEKRERLPRDRSPPPHPFSKLPRQDSGSEVPSVSSSQPEAVQRKPILGDSLGRTGGALRKIIATRAAGRQQPTQHVPATTPPEDPTSVLTRDTWTLVHKVLLPCFKEEKFQSRLIGLYEDFYVVNVDKDDDSKEHAYGRKWNRLCNAAAKLALQHSGLLDLIPHDIAKIWLLWFVQTRDASPDIIDQEMQRSFDSMSQLLNPQMQADGKKVNPTHLQPRRGRVWKVVGGMSTGGLIARRGEHVKSQELKERLAHSAIVEEIELAQGGKRLHYRLLAGDGPTDGWVSTVRIQGADYFLQPWPDSLEGGAKGKVVTADRLRDRTYVGYAGGA